MTCPHIVIAKSMPERLDWLIHFERTLGDDDTIISAQATCDNPWLWETTIEQLDGQHLRLWLAGGLPNHSYTINIQIKTEKGRTFNQCIKLRVRPPISTLPNWLSPDFINDWADRIYTDCHLGF